MADKPWDTSWDTPASSPVATSYNLGGIPVTSVGGGIHNVNMPKGPVAVPAELNTPAPANAARKPWDEDWGASPSPAPTATTPPTAKPSMRVTDVGVGAAKSVPGMFQAALPQSDSHLADTTLLPADMRAKAEGGKLSWPGLAQAYRKAASLIETATTATNEGQAVGGALAQGAATIANLPQLVRGIFGNAMELETAQQTAARGPGKVSPAKPSAPRVEYPAAGDVVPPASEQLETAQQTATRGSSSQPRSTGKQTAPQSQPPSPTIQPESSQPNPSGTSETKVSSAAAAGNGPNRPSPSNQDWRRALQQNGPRQPQEAAEGFQSALDRDRTVGAPKSLTGKLQTSALQGGPRYAYRARDVGEEGVPINNSHSQAGSDLARVRQYAEPGQRSAQQGEVIRIDLSKLDAKDFKVHNGPDGSMWYKFTRPLKESEVEVVK